jgi:LPS export ABC transporter ATP-binding protein
LLEVNKLTKRFGGITAIDNVSLQIEEGEIVGLIGPNGSGKTTLFNCISGFYRPDEGKILFNGEDITNLRMCDISKRGIARTFQLTRIFPRLSVIQNMIVAQSHKNENILMAFRKSTTEIREKALKLLKFVGLDHLKNEPAGELSYGQQKLLEFAMSLMQDPKLLLLDEPAAGINPVMIEKIKEYIREVNKKGLTIFLIEHKMDVVMDLCKRIYVLNYGKLIAEGKPKEIQENPEVLEAYLGG